MLALTEDFTFGNAASLHIWEEIHTPVGSEFDLTNSPGDWFGAEGEETMQTSLIGPILSPENSKGYVIIG